MAKKQSPSKTDERAAEAARELLDRRKARAEMAAYTRYLDIGLEPARHHALICDKLEAVERGEITRLMIFMPPGSAKSTYGSVLFPAWFIGKNPAKNIIAASHSKDLAERFGRRVRNILNEPTAMRLFEECRLSSDSQAAGRWATTKGGEYYAAGVGTGILGFRADFGLIDDPVAGREDADSENSRERVWSWYKDDFKTRLKPGAPVVLIMQRWHEDDLAGRLLADMEKGGDKWTVLRLPMIAEEDDAIGRKEGEPLWPEYFTDEMRVQAQRDERSWLALYQQRPRPDSGGEFKRDWIQNYQIKPTRGLNVYVLVDPASQKKKTSDYTAMWCVGLGSDQNIYILDCIRDRLNLTERADRVFDWHRKYKPIRVGYEKYSMQADVEHIKDRQERENYRFSITELGGTLKKEDRIRRLIPLFEGRRVWFPTKLVKTDMKGVPHDLVEEFIQSEYLPFPVGIHDDMLDSLSRLCDPDLGIVWPKEGQRVVALAPVPKRYENSSVAWMA